MKIDKPFNAWLIGQQSGTDRIRMLAPPSPHDLMTPDDCMMMAAYLLASAGCDRERFGAILDAVLDT